MDLELIDFKQKNSEIFAKVAKEAAYYIKSASKHVNKNTQLRKFYDELVMWNDKVQLERGKREEKFRELEPFIKMLKAKVAYAEGRKHVDQNFSQVFERCIDQIDSADSLKDAKLFFEAVMGFTKALE